MKSEGYKYVRLAAAGISDIEGRNSVIMLKDIVNAESVNFNGVTWFSVIERDNKKYISMTSGYDFGRGSFCDMYE